MSQLVIAASQDVPLDSALEASSYVGTLFQHPKWFLALLAAVLVGGILGIARGRTAAFIILAVCALVVLLPAGVASLTSAADTATNALRYTLVPLLAACGISLVADLSKRGY